MQEFFTTDRTLDALKEFRSSIKEIKAVSPHESSRNKCIIETSNYIISKPKYWDESCQINIRLIGETFNRYISKAELTFDCVNIDDISVMLLRFAYELYLSQDISNQDGPLYIIEFMSKHIDDFTYDAKAEIRFTLYRMPILLLGEIAKHEHISKIKDFEGMLVEADAVKRDLEFSIPKATKEVNDLKENLDKQKTGYNFVGLNQGFENLNKIKRDEIKATRTLLLILAAIPIMIISYEIYFIIGHSGDLAKISRLLLTLAIPTISIIAISLYYFKIALINYRSVKSQILQIELRKSLCQFIQNYAEYSGKLKRDNEVSLEKFETLIFSGIVANEDQIPSTLDGAEQLSKLINSFKS